MADKTTPIFRVALDRECSRGVEIAASASLYKLAEAIVRAFGFDFDHAFGFYGNLGRDYSRGGVKYELFADMRDEVEVDEDSQSVEKTSAATAFPRDKTKLQFLFDYGDEWRFIVERIGAGTKAAGVRYPRTVKSVGEAPEQYADWEG